MCSYQEIVINIHFYTKEVVKLLSSNLIEQSRFFVQQSRKRCHSLGYLPTDSANDQTISAKRVKQLISENNELLTIAKPIIKKLFPYIKKRKQIILLANLEGHILYSAGNTNFSNHAQQVQLQVGANWHEQNKGTNAIGVAIHERKPNIVYGDEHFFRENQFLTCSACPIYSSTGEILGVINISGQKSESLSIDELLLAELTAETIQNRLLYEQVNHEHLLTLKELEVSAKYHPHAILSIDEDKRIVRANRAAEKILGHDCVGKEFEANENYLIETISDQTKKVWRSVVLYPSKANQENKQHYAFSDIKGTCPKIEQVKQIALKAAFTDFPILINGESGTGKELFAQSIHSASPRNEQPFIAVNCSSIPEALVESELFGYEAGAFTGAKTKGSIGKFEAANHGTLFLDEIGDMSLKSQAALLRVLQEKVITPIGSTKSKSIDVRIIAATHRNLKDEIANGNFREDLYYRLRGICMKLPSLKERSDLILLAEDYLNRMNYRSGLTNDAKHALTAYHWPGNIRELKSVLMQAMFLADGRTISHADLQLESEAEKPIKQRISSLKEAEIETIKNALYETEGNISKAAQILEIGRNTLYRKMKEYDL